MGKSVANAITQAAMKEQFDYSPENFFVKSGLYARWSLAKMEAADLFRIVFCKSLDAYCLGCERHSVFHSNVVLARDALAVVGPSLAEGIVDPAKFLACSQVNIRVPDAWKLVQPLNWLFRPRTESVVWNCTRDASHQMTFIYQVDNKDLMKIGQVPSVADIHRGDLKRFRRVLDPADQQELSTGIGLFAHGVGIGSFVYLRRIFERQIEKAHVKASKEGGWDEKAFQEGRMDDRIFLLKKLLPAFLVQNRKVYGVLSRGLHELGEDQCREYFPAVLKGIELILRQQTEQLELAEEEAAATKAIAAIHGKLKGGDEK